MRSTRVVPGTASWRLRSLLWYLKRPTLYPQLIRNVNSGLLDRRAAADTREEAEIWCEQRAVSPSKAIATIAGLPAEPVRERFSDVFAKAEETAAACPVAMGGAASLDLLYWVAEHLQAEAVVETGVAYGWSSLALLLSLAKRDRALLISTDMPYPNRNNDQYVMG